MEDILEEISRDSTSARLKHLKEACVTANGMKFEVYFLTWELNCSKYVLID